VYGVDGVISDGDEYDRRCEVDDMLGEFDE